MKTFLLVEDRLDDVLLVEWEFKRLPGSVFGPYAMARKPLTIFLDCPHTMTASLSLCPM
jgi:hypothetical protein